MKKEAAAVALLLVIFSAAIWNNRHLKGLTESLSGQAAVLYDAVERGSWAEADAAAAALTERWEDAEKYTHVFIRHGEIDAVTNTVCTLRAAVRARDTQAVWASSLQLRTTLSGIRKTERLRLGSIF